MDTEAYTIPILPSTASATTTTVLLVVPVIVMVAVPVVLMDGLSIAACLTTIGIPKVIMITRHTHMVTCKTLMEMD